MNTTAWNQWLSQHTPNWLRVTAYPAPEPLPRTRTFWWATGVVVFAMLAFATFFIAYLTHLQDVYMTHAEDLGIMDQAIWNTLHGELFHQTICNIIGDTNCVSANGISRFAIHFEPILFIITPMYTIAATPKTLIVVQTLVVASGALPAFWLARLRLRNDWAGVVIALIYLLYPAQQHATVFDFHAVTLTVAFVMFLLYFLYMRQTVWIFVFALLSLACKEEIAGVIALCGAWTLLLQHRWRTGLGLIVLSFAWVGLVLYIIHRFSPTGQSLLTSRYSYLGSSPVQAIKTILHSPLTLLKEHVLEPTHLFYLRVLLTPTAYLALLAPWVLVLGAPTLLLNLLSTDPQMYSGLFQYNAELVPILIFSTIEAFVVLAWLTRTLLQRVQAISFSPFAFKANRHTQNAQNDKTVQVIAQTRTWKFSKNSKRLGLALALGLVLFSTVRADRSAANLPLSVGFVWPQKTAHDVLAQSFLREIPATASLSAQSSLVPHVSHRADIYLFPYADKTADYVFLDVTSDIYPFYSSDDYINEAKSVLLSGQYGVRDAHDGYILLEKGLSAPGVSPDSAAQLSTTTEKQYVMPNLPSAFCSYIVQSAHQPVPNPVNIQFKDGETSTPSVALVGVQVNAAARFSLSAGYMSVTTYWHVLDPSNQPFQIATLVTDQQHQEKLVSADVPALLWCQTQTWKQGLYMKITSQVFSLHALGLHTGPASISLALIPLLKDSNMADSVAQRRLFTVTSTSHTIVPNILNRTVRVEQLTLTK